MVQSPLKLNKNRAAYSNIDASAVHVSKGMSIIPVLIASIAYP